MRNMNQTPGNCPSKCNPPQRQMSDCCGRYNSPQNRMSNSCKKCHCEDKSTMCSDPLRGMPIGMGYVPWQEWGCVYNYDEGLSRGTIFPPLDLPFYGCIPRGLHTDKGGNA